MIAAALIYFGICAKIHQKSSFEEIRVVADRGNLKLSIARF